MTQMGAKFKVESYSLSTHGHPSIIHVLTDMGVFPNIKDDQDIANK